MTKRGCAIVTMNAEDFENCEAITRAARTLLAAPELKDTWVSQSTRDAMRALARALNGDKRGKVARR